MMMDTKLSNMTNPFYFSGEIKKETVVTKNETKFNKQKFKYR